MANQWSIIDSWEVHNSRREWMDADGSLHASVLLMCKWINRWTLFQDLLTSFSLTQWGDFNDNGVFIPTHWRSFYLPRAYPDFYEGLYNVRKRFLGVSNIAFETVSQKYTTDGDAEVMDYTLAFLRVDYVNKLNISDSIEYKAEYLTLEGTNLAWASDPDSNALSNSDFDALQQAEAPSKILYNKVLTRTITGCDPDAVRNLMRIIGYTNVEPYNSIELNTKFDIQTLLLEEVILSPSLNLEGLKSQNLLNPIGSEEEAGPGAFEMASKSSSFDAGHTVKLKFLYKPLITGNTLSKQLELGVHNYFWRPRRVILNAQGQPTTYAGHWDFIKVQQSVEPKSEWKPYRPYTEHVEIGKWLHLRPQKYPVFAPDRLSIFTPST
jgi:hypothetical protein